VNSHDSLLEKLWGSRGGVLGERSIVAWTANREKIASDDNCEYLSSTENSIDLRFGPNSSAFGVKYV
jgi:hypothetical protein